MRILLSMLFFIPFVLLKAQTPVSIISSRPVAMFSEYHRLNDSIYSNKKWFLSKYQYISAGFSFFNGGSATILSAPMGIQLNRRLTNNLIAYAGISVAPAYINFNHSFRNAAMPKNYIGNNLSSFNNFGLNSRAEVGLMYINDEKTFSISGSIGIERSSYPVFLYNREQRAGHLRY